jgi:hypothetical protein
MMTWPELKEWFQKYFPISKFPDPSKMILAN